MLRMRYAYQQRSAYPKAEINELQAFIVISEDFAAINRVEIIL